MDWQAHPAEAIIALTGKGKYVVKRRGMPLQEFGLVDAAAAKRAVAAGGANTSTSADSAAAHILTEMQINDFEGSRKAFAKEACNNMMSGELDLGALLRVCLQFCFCELVVWTKHSAVDSVGNTAVCVLSCWSAQCLCISSFALQCCSLADTSAKFADDLDNTSLLECCSFLVCSC